MFHVYSVDRVVRVAVVVGSAAVVVDVLDIVVRVGKEVVEVSLVCVQNRRSEKILVPTMLKVE